MSRVVREDITHLPDDMFDLEELENQQRKHSAKTAQSSSSRYFDDITHVPDTSSMQDKDGRIPRQGFYEGTEDLSIRQATEKRAEGGFSPADFITVVTSETPHTKSNTDSGDIDAFSNTPKKNLKKKIAVWVVFLLVVIGALVGAFAGGLFSSNGNNVSSVEKTNDDIQKTDNPSMGPTQESPTTSRQSIAETIKLFDSQGEAADQFGWRVAIDGNVAVVASYFDDDISRNSGSVHVYEYIQGNWTFVTKLTDPNGKENDFFGSSVAVKGTRVIVGALYSDGAAVNSGAVFIYDRASGWNQSVKLFAADGTSDSFFGFSVDIDENQVIVGAWRDSTHSLHSGAVYIFEDIGTDNWTQVAKLTAENPVEDAQFGFSVAVDGTKAFVGAWRDNGGAETSGAVYVFEKENNTWTQAAKLISNDGAPQDGFGQSIAVSEGTLVVGSHWDIHNGIDAGSAYVFEEIGCFWREIDKLTASDGSPTDRFGISVSVSGDTIVIGAYFDDDNGADSGSAYVFKRSNDGWEETTHLLPSDGMENAAFGVSVSISGSTVIVGAFLDNARGADSGSAYIFEL